MHFKVVYFRYYVSLFLQVLEDTFGFQQYICTEGKSGGGGGGELPICWIQWIPVGHLHW